MFDVLVHLIRHRDRVVTKTELLDTVWGDRFVSESALASRLKSARRGVGDDGSAQRVIRTVFGRGYQFVAPVVEHLPAAGAEAAATSAPTSRHAADERVPLHQIDPVLHRARWRPHRLRHDGRRVRCWSRPPTG